MAGKILVVDDEEVLLDLVKEFLVGEGYEVLTALDGEEGLKIIKECHDLDLVLTDVRMEKMSGMELLKLIRDYRSDLPVIIITGYKTIDNTIEALRNGAVDFITKPFNLAELKKIVNRIFASREKAAFIRSLDQYLVHAEFEYKLEAGLIDTEALSRYMSDLLVINGVISPGEAIQMYIVFNETITNALEHGCLELDSRLKKEDFSEREFQELKMQRLKDERYAKRTITISLSIGKDKYSFTVEDEGPGFDYKKILENLESDIPNMDAFGRGFMFISHMIDQIEFNEKGNRITLIKNRN